MRIIAALFILTSTLFLVTTCCDDCSVCPKPEAGEHLFYIAPKQGNLIKVFSVEQEAFIDSITVDSVGTNEYVLIHIIGDDSLLAVSAGNKTYFVDIKTKSIVNSINKGGLIFSRDSRYYFSGNSLVLYPEHTPIFTDPNSHGFVKFSNKSEFLTYQYYITPGDPVELGLYDISENSATHTIETWHEYPVSFFQSQAIGKLKKTYLDAQTFNAFGVCDFDADTFRLLKSFPYNGSTTLVVSPDERHVFFTDYGPAPFGYGPSGHIFVWDAESEDSVAAISYSFTGIEQFNMLVVSYDNRYLLGRPFNEMDEFTTFYIFDVREFELIGIYNCGFLTGNVTSKYCSRNMLFH